MSPETLEFVAAKALEELRRGSRFGESVAYELGGMPFVDPIRRLIRPGDKPLLKELMGASDWWHRYLGVNISRSVLDEDLVDVVRASWQAEPHFHTRLAMIYLLLHFGCSLETRCEIVQDLEMSEDEFLACIDTFYRGSEGGTWRALCARLLDAGFAGARPVYLLSLALLAERGQAEGQRPKLTELINSEDELLRRLSQRVAAALEQQRSFL